MVDLRRDAKRALSAVKLNSPDACCNLFFFDWKAITRASTGNALVLSQDLIFGDFGDLWCTKYKGM